MLFNNAHSVSLFEFYFAIDANAAFRHTLNTVSAWNQQNVAENRIDACCAALVAVISWTMKSIWIVVR